MQFFRHIADDLVGVAVILPERMDGAGECVVPVAQPPEGRYVLRKVAIDVERCVRVEKLQQPVFVGGDILPFVYEYKPVPRLQLPAEAGEDEAERVQIAAEQPLADAETVFRAPHRLFIKQPRELDVRAALPYLHEILVAAQRLEQFAEAREPLADLPYARGRLSDLLKQFGAAGDAVGIGFHLFASAADLVPAQVGHFLLYRLFEAGKVFEGIAHDAPVHMRYIRSRPVEGEQPAIEVALVLYPFPLQVGRKELFRGGDFVHEFTERFVVIQPALRAFLDLAEHGAAHAHAGVADPGKRVELGAEGRHGAVYDLFHLLPEEHPRDAVIYLFQAGAHVVVEFLRIDISEVGFRLFRGIVDLLPDVDALVFQKLQEIFVDAAGLDLFQLEHLRKLVDEGVEGIARRDDEHVRGFEPLVVVHEKTQAVQHDHGLAASRTALQDKAVPLGKGDDLVLLFLYGFDDVGDLGGVFAGAQDLFEVGIEDDLLVTPRYLLFGEKIAQVQVFVFVIEKTAVFRAQRAAQDLLVIILVDGKEDLALLVILAGEGRAPVDDLEVDISSLADIVAVVPLFVVEQIHARKIRLGEKALVPFYLRAPCADTRIRFDDGAVGLGARPLFAERGDFFARLFDLTLELIDVQHLQERHDDADAQFFVRALFVLVEQVEKVLFVRLLAAAYKFLHLFGGQFRHMSPLSSFGRFSCTKRHQFSIPHICAKRNPFAKIFAKGRDKRRFGHYCRLFIGTIRSASRTWRGICPSSA